MSYLSSYETVDMEQYERETQRNRDVVLQKDNGNTRDWTCEEQQSFKENGK